ncbi:hypothetical protein RHSIM_Rhsim13G0099800 [Rhododendron simsii]|uniref:Carboxypeptidase n=1 Tax=Rhododendron simsii TaxID=118357 RepID=A0A834G1P3_RHOSS|nr:hypothetical protein RHSIM_Rhsim13G0099800 [Rhododendron simsii]
MEPTFSLLLLLLLSPLSSAIGIHDANPSQSSPQLNFPKTQAQKLIRGLNLSPKHDINTGPGNGHTAAKSPVDGPMMVEKPLRLPVLGDAGNTIQDLGHHAGYYRLPHAKDARMFYFFFESRKNKSTSDPVVIWLTGGPGCSSELALFYENGPFHIAKNLSLLWNEFGWDQASNLIYVDQPTGTGFSYSSNGNDTRHDENGVSNDLYDFLQGFFKLHPQYAKNEFYITGESYAGHYIPAFAARVHQGNKAKEGIHVNLKGFAIGNGLTDPEIQYKAYPDFALDMKLINQSDYTKIVTELVPSCEQAATLCGDDGGDSCTYAYENCNSVFNEIIGIAGDINYYDIRKKCVGQLCYDFSNMENLLNKQTVRDALGVGRIEFVSCSSTVYEAMLTDWMRNLEARIPTLLEDGIKMLVYAGEYDLICNWLGNSRWVNAMVWSGQKEFTAAPNVSFVVDGAEKGVHDAGHMVPMDQPKAALEMLRRWTQGKLSVTTQSKFRIVPM